MVERGEMMLRLTASGIRKSYDGIAVLNGCTVDFGKPGVYALTGPNGCGKSTFLRICAMLEPPDAGEVAYCDGNGVLPQSIQLMRRVTLVLPKVGLFNATVFGNAAYGLHLRGITGCETEDRVNRALELAGLTHKRNQSALTLSSGEAQRLGIARALIVEPEVLFLDEPTASVDEKNTAMIEEIIQSLRRDGKTIIVMTTHDRDQAARLADCRIAMRDGGIAREPVVTEPQTPICT